MVSTGVSKTSNWGSSPYSPANVWVGSPAARAPDCKSGTEKHRWFESNPAHQG